MAEKMTKAEVALMAASTFAAPRFADGWKETLEVADEFYEWLKKKEPITDPNSLGPL